MNENEAWSWIQNGCTEHGNGGIWHKQDDQSTESTDASLPPAARPADEVAQTLV